MSGRLIQHPGAHSGWHTNNVTTEGLLAFTADGVEAFATVDQAEWSIQAYDIEVRGKYGALFTLDGEVVEPHSHGCGCCHDFVRTGRRDRLGLLRQIQDADDRGYLSWFTGSRPIDPTELAVAARRRQWEQRRPRWPLWLDKWMHGERPKDI